jgi:hypothetical protein
MPSSLWEWLSFVVIPSTVIHREGVFAGEKRAVIVRLGGVSSFFRSSPDPTEKESSLPPSHNTCKLIFTSYSYHSYTSIWPSSQKPIFVIQKPCGDSSSPLHDKSECSPLSAEGL